MLWHEERSRFSGAEAEGGLHDCCVQGLHICFSWDLHRLMTAVPMCESYPTSYWAVDNFPLKYFLNGKPMANYMEIWWLKDCLKMWIWTWKQIKKVFLHPRYQRLSRICLSPPATTSDPTIQTLTVKSPSAAPKWNLAIGEETARCFYFGAALILMFCGLPTEG